MCSDHAGSRARLILARIAGSMLAFLCACENQQDPHVLVAAAIEAHGGRERLARLDNVKVVGRGRFKGQVEMTGTVSFVAPVTWAVDARLRGRSAMRFGMDAERCWRKDRQFVKECSPEDEREYRRFGEVLRFRLLHGLDDRPLLPARYRQVGGMRAPAVRAGAITLAFDPESHRLVETSWGEWSERYSNFVSVGGALIAAARTVFVKGELDVEETWEEILAGQADLELLHPPPPARDGQTLDDVDAERWVATAKIADLEADLARTIGSLDESAREHGRELSASDGLVLTEFFEERSKAVQWEISIGLEPTRAAPASSSSPSVRFEHWPEARFVGVFHRGDPRAGVEKRALVLKLMEERGLAPAAGSRWQFVHTRESLADPLASRMFLLRLAVVPARPVAPERAP
jgi:hypothetical protein